MACSTVRTAILDKAAPIASISRMMPPLTQSPAATVARPTLSTLTTPSKAPQHHSHHHHHHHQPTTTYSTAAEQFRASSTSSSSSCSSSESSSSIAATAARSPLPPSSSAGVMMSSPIPSPVSSTATATTTNTTPAVSRPRFIPRNRRSLTSAGGESKNWAILFPGQGSQFVSMGKDLYDTYPVARQVVDEADEALDGTLKHVMFEGSQEDLTRTENAQPAILTTSIAMLRVLESERGFKIDESCKYALGHSLGEYTALVATKAVALRDAVKLVRLRGEAMTKAVTNKGTTAMSALVVRPAKLEALVKAMEEIKATLPAGELAEIANINSSFQVVISGTVRGVDHASRMLQAQKIAARAVDLPVSAPFHCSLMQPAADAMKEALKDIKFEKPIIDVISNVTAKPITKVEDISDLLVRQVTNTVQWHTSIGYLRDQENVHDYISLGPGKVLANLLRKEYPLDFVKTVTTAEDIQQWAL